MLLMDLLFCETTSAIWQFVGYLFLVLKTIIPLIIIILGIVDLVKAVLASKDDGLPAAFKSLIMRLILGFSIFFIPTIISMAFSLVKDSATFINASDACQVCLLRPTSDECVTYK
ncbi:MAG: hypothetical protein RSG95_01445, partial [Bacilli bacterium]